MADAGRSRHDELLRLAQEVLSMYEDTIKGYGYEHMGDMWRDFKPLAEGTLALFDEVAAAEARAERALRSLAALRTDLQRLLDENMSPA